MPCPAGRLEIDLEDCKKNLVLFIFSRLHQSQLELAKEIKQQRFLEFLAPNGVGIGGEGRQSNWADAVPDFVLLSFD